MGVVPDKVVIDERCERAHCSMEAGYIVSLVALFFMFFFIGAGNVYVSLINNFHATSALFVFCLLGFRSLSDPDFKGWVLSFFLIIAALMGLNYFASLNGGKADWLRTSALAVNMLFVCSFVIGMKRHPSIAWAGLLGICLSALVSIGWAVSWWHSMSSPESHDWIRELPNFRNVRHFGYLLIPASLISIFFYFEVRGALKAILFTVAVAFVAALIWTGGRGAYASFVAGLFFLGFYFSVRRRWRDWLGVLLIIFSAFYLSQSYQTGNKFSGLEKALERSRASENMGEMSSGRLTLWRVASEQVMASPWVGWGGEAFRDRIPDEYNPGHVVQAHNGFLQIALEWGVPFAVVFFGAQIYWFFHAFFVSLKNRGNNPRVFILGLVLCVALGVQSLVDGVYYHGMPLAILSLSFAIVIWGDRYVLRATGKGH